MSAPTNLGYALLGLLHQEARSGYDLRKVFDETALGNYSSSPGAIYPALARLEKQGLVIGKEDRTESLRPRKLYRPSANGGKILKTWLSQDVTLEDVSRNMDEVMLRFAFHAVLDDRKATQRFLTQLAHELDAWIGELKAQRQLMPKATPVQPRLALEAGIEQAGASLRWARKALRHFAAQ
jgi:DNA-binding PadR family transcriptional regulator